MPPLLKNKVMVNSKQRQKFLLANLPWHKNGYYGVRAGSRWPHMRDEQEGGYLPFPFFLAYAASLLEKNHVDVVLIDAIAEKMSDEEFLEKALWVNADYLVAETSVPSFYDDIELLKKISSSGLPIILCGPNSEIYKPQFLKDHPFVSYVLFGEYEFSLLELARSLREGQDLSKVDGLIFRDGPEIVKNPKRNPFDIDLLPWPHREKLPMGRYLDAPGGMLMPSVQMMASRGCPFQCSFCLWPQVMYQGSHYRPRDVKDVADEMEFLVKEKGFKSVYFDDDTFNIGKDRMLKLCEEFKKRGLEKTPWAIMARPDLMDEEILKNMKDAGLWAVKYGIESAAENLTRNIGKSMDLNKAEEIIRLTNQLGIKTHLTFTFGLPGETKETIERTICLAQRLEPFSVQFSIATPFPGTVLFDELDKKRKIRTKDWSLYDGYHSCVFEPEHLTAEDLEEAKRRAYGLWMEHGRRMAVAKGKIKNFPINDHQDSFVAVLIGYLKRHGLKATMRKAIREFLWKNLQQKYSYVLGIYDGEYAYRGPKHVQIDLTNRCNNACLACWCNSTLFKTPRLSEKEKNESLPLGMVKGLLDELAQNGVKEIAYSGSGEPFMHPDIMEILEYTKKKNLFCLVNTNFTLLDKEKLDRLIEIGLDSITVSTWAAMPETYVKTHPNRTQGDFFRIKENLIYLNTHKSGKPSVHLYNVIFNRNYFELEAMIDFAVETGSEMIGFALVDTMPKVTDVLLLDEKQLIELKEACQRVSSRLDEKNRLKSTDLCFSNFNQFVRRISVSQDAQQARYDRNIIDSMPCYNGWLFARVIPNGQVHSCLKAHRIPAGSLYKNNFSEIWNSPQQMIFRRKTCVYEKSDPFFRLIGNDPDIKEAGCYKSCDDIGRNIWMHERMATVSDPEKVLLKRIVKVFKFIKKFNPRILKHPVKIFSESHKKRRGVIQWVVLVCLSFCSFAYMFYVWLLRRLTHSY
jgi:radical SAM superfamily enzyme YgiQ (UPF0313 family)/molybdenum cofactor biosynthesis enzyme MoaA